MGHGGERFNDPSANAPEIQNGVLWESPCGMRENPDGRPRTQAYVRSMSTATLHQHQPTRVQPSVRSENSQPVEATAAVASSRPAKTDDGTRLLATLSGAAVLVILVFFLAMMWWLSGYGPVN